MIAISVISSIVTGIVGVAVAWIGRRMAKSEALRDKAEQEREKTGLAMREGMMALLRDKLIDGMNTAQKEGYAHLYEVENINHMYNAYTDLGGNGVVTQMHERFSRLPIRSDGGNE